MSLDTRDIFIDDGLTKDGRFQKVGDLFIYDLRIDDLFPRVVYLKCAEILERGFII
jgi:hypothetical protein